MQHSIKSVFRVKHLSRANIIPIVKKFTSYDDWTEANHIDYVQNKIMGPQFNLDSEVFDFINLATADETLEDVFFNTLVETQMNLDRPGQYYYSHEDTEDNKVTLDVIVFMLQKGFRIFPLSYTIYKVQRLILANSTNELALDLSQYLQENRNNEFEIKLQQLTDTDLVISQNYFSHKRAVEEMGHYGVVLDSLYEDDRSAVNEDALSVNYKYEYLDISNVDLSNIDLIELVNTIVDAYNYRSDPSSVLEPNTWSKYQVNRVDTITFNINQ